MIYRFDTLGSSNDEAQGVKYTHGDIIVVERQTSGRGQRGHKWLSGEGMNLTLSAIWEPSTVAIRDQFVVSQAVALAICDMLQSYGLEPKIKWTNDIYIGERKIVGVLIENRIGGSSLSRSVVGIGLNVNQREFAPELPNPTSMSLSAGVAFDREEVLQRLALHLEARYALLESQEGRAQLQTDYHTLLYRLGELHPYRLASGEVLCGQIVGVASTGELIIDWEGSERGHYLFGGVEFIIESRKD